MRIVGLVSLLLAVAPAFAIEATFTPNPADSAENGGAGPLPQSLEQRKQLLVRDPMLLIVIYVFPSNATILFRNYQ